MAYPQRAAVATSNEPSNTVTHTITLPSGIVADSLVLVFVGTDGDISWSNLNGFTELFKLNNGTAGSCSVMYKYCTGGETTVDFISNESEVSTHISWRITGDAGAGRIPEVSTGVALNSQFPDPDELIPTGGAKDYLWIAVEGNDDDDAASVFPLPDNNATNIDSGGCGVSVCSDELNQISLDPTTFTLAGTEQWVACTVVVHPVGLVYKTLVGSIGSASDIPDVPLKRTREFVSVAVAGVSNIVDAPLKRLREFVGETITGVSGIVDVPFKRLRSFIAPGVLNLVSNGEFELWDGEYDLTGWSEATGGTTPGRVQQETSDVYRGKIAAHFYVPLGDDYVQIVRNLTGDIDDGAADYIIEIAHKELSPGITPLLSFMDNSNTMHLQTDMTWDVSSQYITIPYSATWAVTRFKFKKHPSYTGYRIAVREGASGNNGYLIDSVRVYKSTTQLSASFTKLKGFVGETVEGISSLVGDITVTAGAVVKAFIGSIGAISGIADVPLKRIRNFYGFITPSNLLLDGDLENWSSESNLVSWGEYEQNNAEVRREISTVHRGEYGLKIYIPESPDNGAIDQTITLVADAWYKLTFWYNSTYVGGAISQRVTIKDSGNNVWLQDDEISWGSDNNIEIYHNSSGWLKKVIIFKTHPSYTNYKFGFWGVGGYAPTPLTHYFDSISVQAYNQVSGVLKRVRKFIGKLSGLETVYEWIAGQPSPSQGKIDWVAGQPFVEVEYGEPESSVKGVFKRLRGFIGEIISPNLVLNADFENWTSPTDCDDWTETETGGDILQETTEVHSGYSSVEFYKSGGAGVPGWMTSTSFALEADKDYVFEVWFKGTATPSLRINLKDTGNNVWLDDDGLWYGAEQKLEMNVSTSWNSYKIAFRKHPDYTNYIVVLEPGVMGDETYIWIDELSIRLSNSQIGAVLERIRRFTAPAVEGISSVLADLTVILGGGVKAFIGAVGGISDVLGNITGTFSLSGSVVGVSGVADTVLKRLRKFVGVSIDAVSNIVDAPFKRLRKFVGEIISPNELTDGSIENWTGGVPDDWNVTEGGSSTINEESSIVQDKLRSVRGDIDSSNNNAGIYQTFTLEAGARYKITLWYRTSSTNTCRVVLQNESSNVYLNSDGVWGAGWATFTGNVSSQGAWTKFEIEFETHPDYTSYRLTPSRGTSANESYYFDGISVRKSGSQISGVFKALKKFVGITVEGISNITGVFTTLGTVLLQGLVEGFSGVAGVIKGTFVFSGSVGGVSGIADVTLKRLREFVGVSIDAVSNIADASLKRIRKFIGTVGSLSGVDAVLKRIRRFTAPVITGISNIIAPLTKGAEVILQGVVGAISNIDANILVDYVLSGVTGAVSGVDAALGRVRTFIGTIGSLSGVDAVFGRVRKFVGETVQGISSVLGNIQKGAIKAFIGTIGVVSNITDAPLKRIREFIGNIGSISGVSGALSVIYKFIGETVQGVSSVLGELSKLGTIMLSGVIGAISAVDGALKATFSLKGETEGLSEVTGLMKYTASFSGLVEALSGLTGTIVTAATVVFQGVIGSFSNVIGDIKRSRGFTATISSLSGVDAVMKRIRAYIASVNVFSGVNGILKRLRRLSGSILSTTAVDGHVKILYRFIGSIVNASSVTAILGRVKKLVGITVSAVSSVTAELWAGVLYMYPIIFKVVPRMRTFIVEARKRIFKSKIDEDR